MLFFTNSARLPITHSLFTGPKATDSLITRLYLGAIRYNLPEGEIIKAFTNWGMQLPWALPFVIPNLTISAFRFWYQLMWILPTFALGAVAANNGQIRQKHIFLLFWSLLPGPFSSLIKDRFTHPW